jgi:RNA polymerase sigma factor (sigma-70 family)
VRDIPTTRWSLVLRAADLDPAVARRAVAALCEMYWYPVYVFYRRQRCSPDAARELVQDLFLDLIEGNDFARADRSLGRFRNYLLGAASHRLANAKRGGRRAANRELPLTVDETNGDRRLMAEPATDRTPEDEFLAAWAREVVSRALEALAREYATRGDLPFFQRLVGYLAPDRSDPGYTELAAAFGKKVGAVKMAVKRLRERFAVQLRNQVAAYTEDKDVESELRFLLAALTAGAR